MERAKTASVLVLALLALAFFAQSSAHRQIDFATLVQAAGVGTKKICHFCSCPFVMPPCCCTCMDISDNSCRPGCDNCICRKGECYCGDRLMPEQCEEGIVHLRESETEKMMATPWSALD